MPTDACADADADARRQVASVWQPRGDQQRVPLPPKRMTSRSKSALAAPHSLPAHPASSSSYTDLLDEPPPEFHCHRHLHVYHVSTGAIDQSESDPRKALGIALDSRNTLSIRPNPLAIRRCISTPPPPPPPPHRRRRSCPNSYRTSRWPPKAPPPRSCPACRTCSPPCSRPNSTGNAIYR